MNWMMILCMWLAGIPVCMVLMWVMDQAYMADKSWGVRWRAQDGVVVSVGWPVAVVLQAGAVFGGMWDNLWSKQYLFKKKQVKKCNRGMH